MVEIFINSHLLESKIEKENNLAQVFDQVSKWVEDNGKFILNYSVDGEEKERKDLEKIGIHDAKKFEFQVGSEAQVLLSSLAELDSYVEKIGSTLFGRDSLTEKESQDLLDGVSWIESVIASASTMMKLRLDAIKPMGKGNTADVILQNLKSGLETLDSSKGIQDYLENLRDFKLFTMDLMARTSVLDISKEDLVKSIQDFSKEIDTLKKDFMTVNEKYQKGRDQLATEILSDSVGKLNLFLASMLQLRTHYPNLELDKLLVDGSSFEEKANVLRTALQNIAVAYEGNDIVYAGDLMEYELPETLESLKPFLDKLLTLL